MKALQGKRAIVTGSSSGIGRAIARLLAAEGAKVVVNSRGSGPTGTKANDAVVNEITAEGGVAVGIAGAVDDPEFAERLVAKCVEAYGGIDILINNAAIYSPESIGPVTECPLQVWQQTLNVNLGGAFHTSRVALPHMIRQRWGRIINASSFAGTGKMGGSAYSAAKSGLFGLTRAMAADFGPYGITCNVYNPEARTPMGGITDMEILKGHLNHWLERGFRSAAENRYLVDLGDGDGVAPFVAYLCSDDSDYLNGRVFAIESRRVALLAAPEEERILYRHFAEHGRWSIEELSAMAPLAFSVVNQYPRRTGEALERWENSVSPLQTKKD